MTDKFVSFGRLQDFINSTTIEKDKFAYRQVGNWLNGDFQVKCFNSRNSLKTTIQMQNKRERKEGDWIPFVKFEY